MQEQQKETSNKRHATVHRTRDASSYIFVTFIVERESIFGVRFRFSSEVKKDHKTSVVSGT